MSGLKVHAVLEEGESRRRPHRGGDRAALVKWHPAGSPAALA